MFFLERCPTHPATGSHMVLSSSSADLIRLCVESQKGKIKPVWNIESGHCSKIHFLKCLQFWLERVFNLERISCNRLNEMVWCNCKLHVLFHTCESSKFSSNRFLKIFLHSDNVVDYLDVDGDEVGDSEGKESWLLEAPDISLSTTNPSFASIPYFLKYFLDILFSFFLLLSTTCSIS